MSGSIGNFVQDRRYSGDIMLLLLSIVVWTSFIGALGAPYNSLAIITCRIVRFINLIGFYREDSYNLLFNQIKLTKHCLSLRFELFL